MDDRAPAGEPVPPRPSEVAGLDTNADALPRDSIADAIPTVPPSQPAGPVALAFEESPIPEATVDRQSGEPIFDDIPVVESSGSLLLEEVAPELPREVISQVQSLEPVVSVPTTPDHTPMPDEAVDRQDHAPASSEIWAEPPSEPTLPVTSGSGATTDIAATADWEAREQAAVAQPSLPRIEAPWSAPEAGELLPSTQGEGQGAAHASLFADAGHRVETMAPADEQIWQSALIEPAPAPVQPVPARPARLAPSWPPVSLPSKARMGGALSYVRLGLRAAAAVVLVIVVSLLLLVVLYRWIDPPTSTLMLGQRLTGTEVEQTWVPLQRISPNLVHAVILSEDGSFCRHRGVDWPALEEAIESARGGSTITMQVVKNLFLWPSRSYVRKAIEIGLAYLVEALWSKRRILEIYLNIAEWGPGVFGAEAAARNHFGKSAAGLTAQEAALLAVALPNPIERQAGEPGRQTRRLAANLLVRMRAVRTTMGCVRVGRAGP